MRTQDCEEVQTDLFVSAATSTGRIGDDSSELTGIVERFIETGLERGDEFNAGFHPFSVASLNLLTSSTHLWSLRIVSSRRVWRQLRFDESTEESESDCQTAKGERTTNNTTHSRFDKNKKGTQTNKERNEWEISQQHKQIIQCHHQHHTTAGRCPPLRLPETQSKQNS